MTTATLPAVFVNAAIAAKAVEAAYRAVPELNQQIECREGMDWNDLRLAVDRIVTAADVCVVSFAADRLRGKECWTARGSVEVEDCKRHAKMLAIKSRQRGGSMTFSVMEVYDALMAEWQAIDEAEAEKDRRKGY